MSLLNVGGVCKSYGTEKVLENISFEVRENDRIGLIGNNGSGKTTLFRILTGDLSPDDGVVSCAGKTVLGYMEQHVCRNLERPAYDEVLTVFAPLEKMERELEELSRKLLQKPDNADELIERQVFLTERYSRDGGLTYRSHARSAMTGLGFPEDQIQTPIGCLSGGQRAKLQLAKLLLSGANLLLMDEPTNHLDIASVEWLEEFLRSFGGAYFVISHDRYFLDRVTNRTFELKNHRMQLFLGNYSSYLVQREEQDLTAERKYENTQREIRRIGGIIEQQRRWNQARNYVTIASKEKAIARLEDTLEAPEKESAAMNFHFGIDQRGGNDVLEVKDLALEFGGKALFRGANLEIHRQERVFLLGPNGCGKTSLLKALLGINSPAAGSFRFGACIDVGYYDQLQTGLRNDKTVIDEVWDYYPKMTQTEVRSALAIFLFRNDDVFKPVSALSGGERARILLLRLDEPTNHLDIASCEALENALRDYEGTLLVVSHDRYLINRLADKIYFLCPKGTELITGNYDVYLEKMSLRKASEEKEASATKSEYENRKLQGAATRKEKAEMRRLENTLEETDTVIRETEAELNSPETVCDYVKVAELSEKLAGAKKSAEEYFRRWSELAQKYGDE